MADLFSMTVPDFSEQTLIFLEETLVFAGSVDSRQTFLNEQLALPRGFGSYWLLGTLSEMLSSRIGSWHLLLACVYVCVRVISVSALR